MHASHSTVHPHSSCVHPLLQHTDVLAFAWVLPSSCAFAHTAPSAKSDRVAWFVPVCLHLLFGVMINSPPFSLHSVPVWVTGYVVTSDLPFFLDKSLLLVHDLLSVSAGKPGPGPAGGSAAPPVLPPPFTCNSMAAFPWCVVMKRLLESSLCVPITQKSP